MPPRKIQLFDAVHGIESREMWNGFDLRAVIYMQHSRKELGNSLR